LGLLVRGLQRLSAAIAVLALVGGGCHRAPRAQTLDAEIQSYLGDPRFRRRELEASLVDKSNAYSQFRLAHYASGRQGDWDALPAWNPRVEPVTSTELANPGGARERRKLGPAARSIALPIQSAASLESLRAVGREAFFRYPTQLAPGMEHVLRSPDAALQYGLWLDPEYGAGGIVRAEMADGSTAWAFTCASCHASRGAGVLRIGVANAALDLGRIAADSDGPGDAARRETLLAWGPGRLDVSTSEGTEPIRISDLRPLKWLTHLHQTATVEQRRLTSLAIRIETLIVASHDQVVRPPREIAIGLAVYLWSLAPGPLDAAMTPEAKRGRALFDAECRDCHGLEGYAGRPVPVNEVGTDPRLGLSKTRGTGMYRVPSLRGVSTRGPLLHDASLAGLGDLFDPERTGPGYRGGRHGAGAVMGHAFGLDLTLDERSDLIAFLATL
jgi:mono/diheme cytochrome c family protein